MEKELSKKIGAAIGKSRRERGGTQVDLAIAVGVDPSFIQKIERGARTPSIRRLKKIANHLNYTTWALLRRAGV